MRSRPESVSAPTRGGLPASLWPILPLRLAAELGALTRTGGALWGKPIEELRLRADRCVTLTLEGENRRLSTVVSAGELAEVVDRICEGSLYAHRDGLAAGVLTLPDGVRVGVCGRASVEGGRVVGIYDVSGLNIRIPGCLRGLGEPIVQWLRRRGDGRGLLIYAPPGGGKTTLLRCVAASLASGPRPLRVAVLDTRGEMGYALGDRRLCLDVLTGYPRPLAVEIATRTMNPQVILCDEIGEVSEAETMVAAQNGGVPFVATAHADTLEGLLSRSGIGRLHRAGVFGAYVGLRRPVGGGEFFYEFTEWGETEGAIQNRGGAFAGD